MNTSLRLLAGIGALALSLGAAWAADPIRIGVANFGEHPQLAAAVDGFKEALTAAGMVEGKDVIYTVSHTNMVFVLDPTGRWAACYVPGAEPGAMAKDFDRLLTRKEPT